MVSPVKEVSSAARDAKEATASTLAEMQESVAALAREVADIAERRTRKAWEAAADTAEAGTAEARRMIRRQPIVSMAVAAAAGAVLALAIVPRFGRQQPSSRWDQWTPNVTRADLYDMADNIQRTVSRAAHQASAPIAPSFERLVDALSRTDAHGSVNSIIDRLGSWFSKAQDRAKEKLG